jgi:hypothetical protein
VKAWSKLARSERAASGLAGQPLTGGINCFGRSFVKQIQS